mgnify:CR=1 FL=1
MAGRTFDEVMERFRTIEIGETFDMVIAIANGGVVPAGIINQRLGLEINLLKINLRDADQKPLYDAPKLVAPIDFEYAGKRILLVDDRIQSGSTIVFAKQLLEGVASVKAFAVNGNADYALFDEDCFRFPWIIG